MSDGRDTHESRSTLSEPREWKMGAHEARFEPPDILWMKYRGPISLDEITWAMGRIREQAAQRALFVVADVTENTSLEPEARRYASERIDPEDFTVVIYIGARLIHKAAAKGIAFVQFLLGRKTTPVYFVSSEAEARDTIARLRRS
jgi:hypothetical protein